MHRTAFEWLTRVLGPANTPATSVLEFGSLDINGSVRQILPSTGIYHGIDLVAGPGVDEVADAARWMPNRSNYDLVVAAEVFEHTPDWPRMIDTAWRALRNQGWFVVTCATDPRPAHSADGRKRLRPGEHYRNVPAHELASKMRARGFQTVTDGMDPPGDLYAIGVKQD